MFQAIHLLVLNATNRSLSSQGLADPPVYLIFLQLPTAFVSFIASTIIVFAITCCGTEGLSSPYRRIIFGLSVSDILQSFALLSGPLAVPRSRVSGAAGTEALSCRVNGFFLLTGALAVMMYTLLLCLYYLCRLKYRMNNHAFRQKIETKAHVFIVVLTLTLSIAALALDTFHINGTHFSFCSIGVIPTGCDKDPEIYGGCEMFIVRRVIVIIILVAIVVPLACFTGIIVIMSLLYQHAYVWNKTVELELSGTQDVPTSLRTDARTNDGNLNSIEEEDALVSASSNCNDGEETAAAVVIEDDDVEQIETEIAETETPQDHLQNLSRLYKREMTIQAGLYVWGFFLTFVPVVVAFTLSLVPIHSRAVDAISIFTYPIGGFFTILVYTRPKVASLRRSYPECSRLRGFWLVIRAGCEIPDEVNLSLTCCQDCCRAPAWVDSEYWSSHDNTNNRDRKQRNGGARSFHLSSIGF